MTYQDKYEQSLAERVTVMAQALPHLDNEEKLLQIGRDYLDLHFALIDALKTLEFKTGQQTGDLRLEFYNLRDRFIAAGCKYSDERNG